ncbi:hypothetical protein [Pleomorphomonas koreensis]|uniref:hypothetical protein n=1 Tax=Pleomorphomonas koreensis TaxID=257440 RepID=UPI0009FD43B3|nr:hypothetical protein [Pleomorphomonas koreensis]
MIDRSNLPEVRNPILALPAFKRLQSLPVETRQVLGDILQDLAMDARGRAEKCWRTHKAPMAFYWKVVSVLTGHIRRALLRGAA